MYVIKTSKTINFPVVLYRCETWCSHIHRFRGGGGGIFECKRDKVAGSKRKLYLEELHNFYSSPKIIIKIISRQMTWAYHLAHK